MTKSTHWLDYQPSVNTIRPEHSLREIIHTHYRKVYGEGACADTELAKSYTRLHIEHQEMNNPLVVALRSLLQDVEAIAGGVNAYGMPLEHPDHPFHDSVKAARSALGIEPASPEKTKPAPQSISLKDILDSQRTVYVLDLPEPGAVCNCRFCRQMPDHPSNRQNPTPAELAARVTKLEQQLAQLLMPTAAKADPDHVIRLTPADREMAKTWTTEHAEMAERIGFRMTDYDGTGALQLQKCDEGNDFKDDDTAVAAIRWLARNGSDAHLREMCRLALDLDAYFEPIIYGPGYKSKIHTDSFNYNDRPLRPGSRI